MMIPPNAFGAVLRPLTVMTVLAPIVGLFFWAVSGAYVVGLCAFMIVVLIMTADCMARSAEYVAFNQLRRRYPRHIVVQKLRTSFCGRGVGIALYGDYARLHYQGSGYTLFNVLPDNSPQCFFTSRFWRRVVGIDKKYPKEAL